jgi:tetratricopeptide (TPR) repeat protein
MSLHEDRAFYKDEAFRLLTAAQLQYPKDPEVLTRLGYLYQAKGNVERATTLYEDALHNDSHSVVALVNLGVIYAQRGRTDDALRLWRQALGSNPGLSEAGVNLAAAVWAKGDKAEARRILHKVLRFNPDLGAAKELQRQMK